MHFLKKLVSEKTTALVLGGAAITGLFSTLSVAPFHFNSLIWFALWPLFYFGERYRYSLRKLLGMGILFSLSFGIFSNFWVAHTIHMFGGIPLIFSILIFLPYTILLNLKIPLFLILFGLSRRRRIRTYLQPGWLVAALLGVIADLITPQIFPWYWGNGAAGNLYLLQIADVTGIHGITFILFALSYGFYRLFRILLRYPFQRRFGSLSAMGRPEASGGANPLPGGNLNRRIRRLVTHRTLRLRILLYPLFLVLWFSYGVFRVYEVRKMQEGLPTLRVAILQPNSPLDRADLRLITKEVIYDLIHKTVPELAKKASENSRGGIDLFVLPESGIPYYSTQKKALTERVGLYSRELDLMARTIAYKYDADLLLNEVDLAPVRSNVDGRYYIGSYNSVVLFSRDGERRGSYNKRKLLAFGEYIPGINFLTQTGLIRFLPGVEQMGRFLAGERSNPLPYSRRSLTEGEAVQLPSPEEWAGLNFSPEELLQSVRGSRPYPVQGTFIPLICYEIMISDYPATFFRWVAKRREDQGRSFSFPEFFVNVTQDGWYGSTIETYQHFDLGRVRAVEYRRALVRSTNSGSSGYVDLLGEYATPVAGPTLTAQDEAAYQVWDVPLNRASPTLFTRYGTSWLWLFIGALLLQILFVILRRKRRGGAA